jgi:hypothetical protein
MHQCVPSHLTLLLQTQTCMKNLMSQATSSTSHSCAHYFSRTYFTASFSSCPNKGDAVDYSNSTIWEAYGVQESSKKISTSSFQVLTPSMDPSLFVHSLLSQSSTPSRVLEIDHGNFPLEKGGIHAPQNSPYPHPASNKVSHNSLVPCTSTMKKNEFVPSNYNNTYNNTYAMPPIHAPLTSLLLHLDFQCASTSFSLKQGGHPVSFFSSLGVSAIPMCPRLANGHIKRPRSTLFIST